MHFQNCKYSFQLKGNRRKMGRKQVGFSNNFSNEFQRGRNRTRRVWSSTPLLVEYGYVWVVPWRLCSRLPWRGNRPYLQTGKQSLLAAQGHLFVAHTSLMWTSTSPSAFCSKIRSCSIQYTKRNTHQEKKNHWRTYLTCVWNGQRLAGGTWMHNSGYKVLPRVTHAICSSRSCRVAHLTLLKFQVFWQFWLSSAEVKTSAKGWTTRWVQSSCTNESSKE